MHSLQSNSEICQFSVFAGFEGTIRLAASIPLVVVPVLFGRLIGRLGLGVPSENHRSESHHSQIRTAIGTTQQIIAVDIEFVDVDIGLALHAYRHRFNLQDLRPETTAPATAGPSTAAPPMHPRNREGAIVARTAERSQRTREYVVQLRP